MGASSSSAHQIDRLAFWNAYVKVKFGVVPGRPGCPSSRPVFRQNGPKGMIPKLDFRGGCPNRSRYAIRRGGIAGGDPAAGTPEFGFESL
jgi:hypothetical protein